MSVQNYFNQFCVDRNIKSNTRKGYKSAICKYEEFNGEKIDFLIEEAQIEERKNLLLKDRKIKSRLISFRNFLFEIELSNNTIKTYISRVKTFYKHFEVELPELPDVKYNSEYETNYFDIPSKEHIKKVLEISPLNFQALILFMSSSGTAIAETISLTVNDFLVGLDDYTKKNEDIYSILKKLKNEKNIIPTFYIKRQKTNKHYYTFCSSEATKKIIDYLLTRKNLTKEDKLFPFGDSHIINTFQKLNDKMKWGFRGKYRFFRSHNLRKFHASNIGLSAEHIDMLQGRSKTSIHETYIKTNPKQLKEIYKKAMPNVMIYPKSVDSKLKNDEIINITINIFISDTQYNLI